MKSKPHCSSSRHGRYRKVVHSPSSEREDLLANQPLREVEPVSAATRQHMLDQLDTLRGAIERGEVISMAWLATYRGGQHGYGHSVDFSQMAAVIGGLDMLKHLLMNRSTGDAE